MIILIDTREKLPLEFTHSYVEGTESRHLSVGDYAAIFKDGHQPPIIFERKSLPDLFGTLSSGYKRFRKEIMRSHDAGIELVIIIEGTVNDILAGIKYSQVDGLKILRTLLSLYERYKINHQFFRNCTEMSTYIVERFCSYERKRQKCLGTTQ